ncbi:MAG TPA: Clp protease N-terminal domain-containing protein [Terriglobales bacterium]|nr:Clp protease N-terminal domain-containing protein [Terriglobales bacterium]
MPTPVEPGSNDQPAPARSVFARYTERARVIVFFARREANAHRSPEIGTEHLLLGLLRGDRRLARKALGSGTFIQRYISSASAMKSIRHNVTAFGEASISDQTLPLTIELRRVLRNAAEEANRRGDKHVRSKHLLLGLLAEAGSLGATLLNQEGVTLQSVRANLGEYTVI